VWEGACADMTCVCCVVLGSYAQAPELPPKVWLQIEDISVRLLDDPFEGWLERRTPLWLDTAGEKEARDYLLRRCALRAVDATCQRVEPTPWWWLQAADGDGQDRNNANTRAACASAARAVSSCSRAIRCQGAGFYGSHGQPRACSGKW